MGYGEYLSLNKKIASCEILSKTKSTGSFRFTVIGKSYSDTVEGRKFMIREFQLSVKGTEKGKIGNNMRQFFMR